MAFVASYNGTCFTCEGRIKEGELIKMVGRAPGKYEHVKCPVERKVTVCDKCHLTKPCECD